MKKKKEKNKGITLIALIITIIVLLILAGVTISMVVGDNGVLKQAQNAKIKTEKAKDEELRGLTAAEAGGNLEMTWYQDGENKVPIPVGFAVSQVEGENRVDDGLVIIDSNGNEFVWIPCGKLNTETQKYDTTKYEGAKKYAIEKWSKKCDNNYNNSSKTWTNTDSSGNDNTGTGENGTINNGKITAKDSIAKYGGFYVARFEAGVPSNAPFYVSNASGSKYVGINGESGVSTKDSINARGANLETEKVQDLKPVSKRGVQAWNCITQQNAKIVSENMYKDNDDVNSYLIDSNAWNYICGDIFGKDEILGEEGIEKSTTYGNYKDNTTTDYTSLDCLWARHNNNNNSWECATNYGKGNITSDVIKGRNNGTRIELATGASDDFKVYNIYDMAGNVWEWTEETYKNSSNVCSSAARGGSFHSDSLTSPVVSAYNFGYYDKEVNIGFRTVLYVK